MLLFAGKLDKDIIIVQRPIAQSDGLSHPKMSLCESYGHLITWIFLSKRVDEMEKLS